MTERLLDMTAQNPISLAPARRITSRAVVIIARAIHHRELRALRMIRTFDRLTKPLRRAKWKQSHSQARF